MNPINSSSGQMPRSQAAFSSDDSLSTTNLINTAGSSSAPSSINGSVLHSLDARSRQQALSDPHNEDSSGSNAVASSALPGSEPGSAAMSVAAVNSAIAADSAGLEAAKSAMENNLSELASNPEKFHAAMEKSFGDTYDKAKAEEIRQQVLDGDFSWMPEIVVVDESVLTDQSGQQGAGQGLGAYSKDNDTIYISRQLLTADPDRAANILTEEVGHGLDTRLNTSDAAGDEGNIFSRIVSGENITDAQLADLKSENDSGTIIVDGKEVEVEFFFKKLFKGIKKGVTGFINGIKDVVSGVWDGVKKIGKSILTNRLLGSIMAFAQFIPIPIVQVVARGYNLLKSGYMLAKGIQHGSVGMILGGVAGVAGGASNLGGALGASQGFVDGAARIASGASKLSTAYHVIAERDFGAAAQLASNYFGGPDNSTGRLFQRASQVINTAEKVQDGDYLGALSSGSALYNDVNGGDESGAVNSANSPGANSAGNSVNTAPSVFQGLINNITGSNTFRAISENVSTIRDIVKMAKEDGLAAAGRSFLANYGEDLGINADTQQNIIRWAGAMDVAKSTVDLVKDNNYSGAIGQAAALLGIPLTENNQQRLHTAFRIRESVLSNNLIDASRHAAVLSMQTGNRELAGTFIRQANLLEGKLPSAQSQAA